ncbi:glycosyltransferase family 4 protein [Salinisphaera hydrothermalis]|uniref:glycosyltransferase family 4 protein n=1 Tax=Salinisphaera hydrothermalis TaxID=563188 RepID=UPI0033412183
MCIKARRNDGDESIWPDERCQPPQERPSFPFAAQPPVCLRILSIEDPYHRYFARRYNGSSLHHDRTGVLLLIYVNGRVLSQPLTGVQRFSRELLRELTLLRDDIVIAAPPDASDFGPLASNVEIVGKRRGLAWEQLELPRFLRARKAPFLINLGNSAPVSYFNQLVVIHDIAFLKYPAGYGRTFRWWYTALLPYLSHTARKIATVSHFSRHEIAKAYRLDPVRIGVVYNAIGGDLTTPHGTEEGRSSDTFFTYASDSRLKNFDTVLAAFAKAREQVPIKLRCLSASEPHAGFIEALNTRFGEQTVVTLGRLDDNALSREYKKALGFVFVPYYAGFGLPPIEAQALDCPVLASRAGALPEVMNDSALLSAPESSTELADNMIALYQQRALAEKLTRLGRENITRFSWRKSAEALNLMLPPGA